MRHATTRAAADVRLPAGRVPVRRRRGTKVAAVPVSLALGRRRAQGRARPDILDVGRGRGRGTLPRPRSRSPGAADQAGDHVAAERRRAVLVHDAYHVGDHGRVPGTHDAALGRGAGRRVPSAPGPLGRRAPRPPRLAVLRRVRSRRARPLRGQHVLHPVRAEVSMVRVWSI